MSLDLPAILPKIEIVFRKDDRIDAGTSSVGRFCRIDCLSLQEGLVQPSERFRLQSEPGRTWRNVPE